MATKETTPMMVTCPACKVGINEPCWYTPYRANRPVQFHDARIIKAQGRNATPDATREGGGR